MRTALTGLFLLTASSLACAADGDPEARLSWQLSFGADRAVASGYSLAFGYREADDLRSDAPMLKLAELSVRDEASVATLAGVPVHGGPRGAQLDDIAYSSSPIYWAWWIATGAVIAIVALEAGDGDDDPAPAGTGGGG